MGSPVYGKGWHDGYAEGADDARSEDKAIALVGGAILAIGALSWAGVKKLRGRRAEKKMAAAVEAFDESEFLEEDEGDA